MQQVAIGLGSNLGDREEYLLAAYRQLRQMLRMPRVSGVYETPPVGYANQPKYLNAVMAGYTRLTAKELFELLKSLELSLGRTKLHSGLPREIDLDLLLYGQEVIRVGREAHLVVPHPRLHERWFALKPLLEVWPGASHPVLRVSVLYLLERIPQPPEAVPYHLDWQRA